MHEQMTRFAAEDYYSQNDLRIHFGWEGNQSRIVGNSLAQRQVNSSKRFL